MDHPPFRELPSKLIWTGEHWVNKIRPEGSEAPSAILRHLWYRYCPGGRGHVAVIRIGGDDGFHGVCTDNRAAAEFSIENMFHRVDYFNRDLPVIDSTFTQVNDSLTEPSWLIEAGQHRIVPRWRFSEPPVIARGIMRDRQYSFSNLFFTDDSSVELDGRPVEGRPYPVETWQAHLGGVRSSSVVALGETFVEVSGD